MTTPTTVDGGNAYTTYFDSTAGNGNAAGGQNLGPYQLTYNGLLMGPNSDVQLVSIKGLRAHPAIRHGDTPRPRSHGAFGGLDFYDERIVTLSLLVSVTTSQAWSDVVQGIANAFPIIEDPSQLLPLQVMLPGWAGPRVLWARVSNASLPVDIDYSVGRANIAVELTCPDPLIYDTVNIGGTCGLPSPTAGLTFPVTFPVQFGASSGGSIPVNNVGNIDTPPVFTINGPCLNPVVLVGGQYIGFGIQLAAGDTLVVDCGAKSATFDGTASRLNLILPGSTWLTLPPGQSTVLFETSDSSQVAGTLAVAANSAWGWA